MNIINCNNDNKIEKFDIRKKNKDEGNNNTNSTTKIKNNKFISIMMMKETL